MSDLGGKISAVVDGGRCRVGLESTIINLAEKPFSILRPGGITQEQIEEVIGPVMLDSVLLSAFKEGRPKAPGMKYRHYAPRAQVVILRGDVADAARYFNENGKDNAAVLCFDGEEKYFRTGKVLAYGREDDGEAQARNLFSGLREA